MIASTTTNTMPGKRGLSVLDATIQSCVHTHTHRSTQSLHTDTLWNPVAALQVRSYPLAGFESRAFLGRSKWPNLHAALG